MSTIISQKIQNLKCHLYYQQKYVKIPGVKLKICEFIGEIVKTLLNYIKENLSERKDMLWISVFPRCQFSQN